MALNLELLNMWQGRALRILYVGENASGGAYGFRHIFTTKAGQVPGGELLDQELFGRIDIKVPCRSFGNTHAWQRRKGFFIGIR